MAASHDWRRLYEDILGVSPAKSPNADGWVPACCPLHEDRRPSFAYNVTHGGFKCQGCDASGSGIDAYGLLKIPGYQQGSPGMKKEANQSIHEVLGTKRYEAKRTSNRKGKLPTENEVRMASKLLLSSPEPLHVAESRRHWSKETMADLLVGWDEKDGRYLFPIYRNGQIENVRKYMPGAKDRKVIGIWNRNGAVTWPEKALQCEDDVWVWIMEGEADTVAARSQGLEAVAFCTGAGTIPKNELTRFQGKKVVVCYDADDAGRKGSKKLGSALMRYTPEIKILDLSEAAKAAGKEDWGGDFTDWLVDGLPIEKLLGFVEKLGVADPKKANTAKSGVIYRPRIKDSVTAHFHHKPIELESVMVVAKSEAPFTVHREATVYCPLSDSKKICNLCPLKLGNQIPWKPKPNSSEYMHQIGVTDKAKKLAVQHQIGAACTAFEFAREKLDSVYELVISNTIDSWSKVDRSESDNDQLTVYAFGSFELNRSYCMKGTNATDPKNQSARLLLTDTRSVVDPLEDFSIDPTDKLDLEICGLFDIEYPSETEDPIGFDSEEEIEDLLKGEAI